MGYNAHIQTKHEIEYGDVFFGYANSELYDWLLAHRVESVQSAGEFGECQEWELDKDELRALPDCAFSEGCANVQKIARAIGETPAKAVGLLRSFVASLLAAPTGDYAYISWF